MKLKQITAALLLVVLTATVASCSDDKDKESKSDSTMTTMKMSDAKDSTALLASAASHMPVTADVLAGAIVKQYPDKFSGEENSTSAQLRSGLTALLQEHVYLAGNATGTALSGADNTKQVAALDANSVALSKAIASVYGDAAGTQFLELWRKHIGFFVDYTTGKATDDSKMVEKAREDLDGYRGDFGAFLESANPDNLTKKAVADELKPHVESLFKAIDAQASEAKAMMKK